MLTRIVFVFLLFCVRPPSIAQTLNSKANYYAIRLKPHQDLKVELMKFAEAHKLKAAFVATCVGSLEQLNLRYANQSAGIKQSGHFEILSLVGTFNNASSHFHLSVADSIGKTIGGHLLEANLIYTTAEIVIGELPEVEFGREVNSTYGYQELYVKPKKKN